jgi:hypothetical protein
MIWSSLLPGSYSTGILDEATLPAIVACNINFPSADLLTPQRVAAQVWSWAYGKTSLCGVMSDVFIACIKSIFFCIQEFQSLTLLTLIRSHLSEFISENSPLAPSRIVPRPPYAYFSLIAFPSLGNPVSGPNENCTAISAEDSLWRTADCSLPLPVLCQRGLGDLTVIFTPVPFAQAQSVCPEKYTVGVPSSALVNRDVAAALAQRKVCDSG